MLPCSFRVTLSVVGSICAASILLASGSTPSLAGEPTPFAAIDSAKGPLLFDGKKIDPHSPITKEGTLQTSPSGSAQVTLLPSKHQLFIGPNTRILLMRPDPNGEQSHLLEEGAVRAKVRKDSIPADRPNSPFRIRTRSSIMGVRGTEFLASFNPALDESELVVFSGQVELYGESDPAHRQLVQPQFRSGIGGRFGHGPVEPTRLTEKALKYYRSLTPEDAPPTSSTPVFEVHPTPGAPSGKAGSTN